MEGKEIIEIIQRGNEAEVAKLHNDIYIYYKPRLKSYLHNKLYDKEIIEDIIHDAFIKIFRSIHKYESTFTISTWIYTIVRNQLIDHFRKNKHDVKNISLSFFSDEESEKGELGKEIDLPDLAPNPYDVCVLNERKQNLLIAIENGIKIPFNKTIITEVYLKERKLEEVSEEFSIPLGTIKANTFRGKLQIKNYLISRGIS